MSKNCPLCASISGQGAHQEDYPIVNYGDFVLIPALAPVQPGHTLLCTKKHVAKMSTLPKHSVDKLELLATHIQTFLLKKCKLPSVLFEHGYSHLHTGVTCGIVHFHLHIIPLPESKYGEMAETVFRDLPIIIEPGELYNHILKREEYIIGKGYYENRWRITRPNFSITSRQILKLIDERLNQGNCLWDEELFRDPSTALIARMMYKGA